MSAPPSGVRNYSPKYGAGARLPGTGGGGGRTRGPGYLSWTPWGEGWVFCLHTRGGGGLWFLPWGLVPTPLDVRPTSLTAAGSERNADAGVLGPLHGVWPFSSPTREEKTGKPPIKFAPA